MDFNSEDFNSDTFTYEYFLQDDVCRLCWCKNADREIISTKIITSPSLIKNELIDKIQDCLGLDLAQLLFPKSACNSCCDKIEKFHDFKKECREKNLKLQELLKEKHNDINSSVVKVEKVEEFSNLEFTKTDLIEDVANFLDSLERNSDIESTGHHSDTEEIKSKKAKIKYKLKRTPTYCNTCRFDLESKENLTQHNEKCHGIEEISGLFKCFGCEKRFRTSKTRRAHEVTFCKGLKDGYKCCFCDRFLPTRSMYESHMRDHRENVSVHLPEDIFQCNKCVKLFKTKESLNKHMDEHVKKKFVCETCGRVFTRHDYLHKHKLTHTGTKEHVCSHCGFRTTQRSSLTVHIRKHTGERPYSCDICPQRCISSSNLRAHLRRHIGLKRYECSICSKKFGYKISLEEHVASTHERSQSYTCEHCGTVYTRRRGLKRHLAAKHGDQPKKTEKTSNENESKKNFVEQNEFVIMTDSVPKVFE